MIDIVGKGDPVEPVAVRKRRLRPVRVEETGQRGVAVSRVGGGQYDIDRLRIIMDGCTTLTPRLSPLFFGLS